MFDAWTTVAIAGVFLLAGTVKGVIGLGLPTISVGLLTAILDLPTAMALIIVPALLTNLWQASNGGNFLPLALRLWPFLLTATGTVWLGALALTGASIYLLSALLGAVLFCYGGLGLSGLRPSIPTRKEKWAGPAFGTANGILTGLTGSFVVPGVMYLQALGLSRDMLIQAMGMLFALSSLALAGALGSNDLLSGDLALSSAAAVVPALAGVVVGQKLRKTLSEALFRRVFFFAILLLGLFIVVRELF